MLVYDNITINASNRKVDKNGFLKVKSCNITKEQVAPYFGSEIPNWREFGLDSKTIYYVYRPETELAKAADTFNNLPLTRDHIEVAVDDVPKERIVGSLGDRAEYKAPYLTNSLMVYDKTDIDNILNGNKKELSCGYRYTPVKKSGEWHGQHYDFVMTDIVGNHVALVKEGRAGHDVVVADSKPDFEEKGNTMTEDETRVNGQWEDDDDIEWITVRGTHIPIKKGEDKGKAIENFFKRNEEAKKGIKNAFERINKTLKEGASSKQKEPKVDYYVDKDEDSGLYSVRMKTKDRNGRELTPSLKTFESQTEAYKFADEMKEQARNAKKEKSSKENTSWTDLYKHFRDEFDKVEKMPTRKERVDHLRKLGEEKGFSENAINTAIKKWDVLPDDYVIFESEAKQYWEDYHKDDPVMSEYDSYEDWFKESKENGYILPEEKNKNEEPKKEEESSSSEEYFTVEEEDGDSRDFKSLSEAKSFASKWRKEGKSTVRVFRCKDDEDGEPLYAKVVHDSAIPDEQDKPETAGEEKAEQEESKMTDENKEALAEDKCAKDEKDIEGKEKKAFAEGVDYGEEKEKSEPKKLDSEHESEGTKKADEKKKEEKEAEDKCTKDSALTMDIDTIKAQVREEVIADFKAREEARKSVESIVGEINVMAFDSCSDIYKLACEKEGLPVNEIVSYKDALTGYLAGKSKLTVDASPVSGSNEECFKDIRV